MTSEYSRNLAYDVILSHGPGCADGSSASWVYWRQLPHLTQKLLSTKGGHYGSRGKEKRSPIHPNSVAGAKQMQKEGYPVVFAFVNPQSAVDLDLVRDRNVLILDLDLGPSLKSVVDAAKFTMLIDHHDSTFNHLEEITSNYPNKFNSLVDFRPTESGATLAWKFFRPGEPVPDMLEVVRIRDTWQWEDRADLYPREISKALIYRRVFNSFPHIESTYNNWDNKRVNQYKSQGALLLQQDTVLAEKMARDNEIGYITTTTGQVYTVGYTQASVLRSEVADLIRELAEDMHHVQIDFAATWKYTPNKSAVSVSIRDPRYGLNLGRIAETVCGASSGGGHVEAASFAFYGIENFHKVISREKPDMPSCDMPGPQIMKKAPGTKALEILPPQPQVPRSKALEILPPQVPRPQALEILPPPRPKALEILPPPKLPRPQALEILPPPRSKALEILPPPKLPRPQALEILPPKLPRPKALEILPPPPQDTGNNLPSPTQLPPPPVIPTPSTSVRIKSQSVLSTAAPVFVPLSQY